MKSLFRICLALVFACVVGIYIPLFSNSMFDHENLDIENYGSCDVPVGDSCLAAIDIGFLKTAECEEIPNSKMLKGCLWDASPETGIEACPEFLTTGTVWFKADYDEFAFSVAVHIAPKGEWEARISMFTGDCSSLTPLVPGCSNLLGSPNHTQASVPQGSPSQGGTVWIAVSYDSTTVDENTDLNFDIEIHSERECISCDIIGECKSILDIEVMRRSSGRDLKDTIFCPGESVELCMRFTYKVSVIQVDWLQGLLPRFGPGWDMTSFDPNATRITPAGAEWRKYDDSICGPIAGATFRWIRTYMEDGQLKYCNNACENCPSDAMRIIKGDPMPSGWYYMKDGTSVDCDSTSCRPAESWGLAGSNEPTDYQICMDLRVKSDFSTTCMEERNLDIAIFPTSDALTGCWPSSPYCFLENLLVGSQELKIGCMDLPSALATGTTEVGCTGDVAIELRAESGTDIAVYAVDNPHIERIGSPDLISSDQNNPTLAGGVHFSFSETVTNTSSSVQIQRYVYSSLDPSQVCPGLRDTFEVRVQPSFHIQPTEYQRCKDKCVNIIPEVSQGEAPYSYLWEDGDMLQNRWFCDEDKTSYSVMVTDQRGCVARQEYSVKTIGTGSIRLVNSDSLRIEDLNLVLGETSTQYVQVDNPNDSIYSDVVWQKDQGLDIDLDPNRPTRCAFKNTTMAGRYSLSAIVTDTFGCIYVDTIHVLVGTCTMQPEIDTIICDDGGTLGAQDDTFLFDLKIIGNGASWYTTDSLIVGNYNDLTRLGPFLSSEGAKKITIYDSEDSTCSSTFEVFPPQSCLPICGTHPDYAPLMALYNGADGPNWKNNKGWAKAASGVKCNPCDDWYGVTCDSMSRVKGLDLRQNNLKGNIPDGLGKLDELSVLLLSENMLGGSIPAGLGELSKLEQVSLSRNLLNGDIPSEIGDLTFLRELDLSFNYLGGKLPPALGKLSSLERMVLANNNLWGGIPSEIGNITSLKSLVLSSNKFSWNIPSKLGQLNDLDTLALNNNNFESCILASLQGYLCSRSYVDLSGNPRLPWQGDIGKYCAGDGSLSAQIGAPCDDGDDSNGESDVIDDDCTCSATVSTNEVQWKEIYVFPSPTTATIYVQGLRSERYRLLDIYGRVVEEGRYNSDGIDVGHRSSGVYILKLFYKNQWISRKVQIVN